MNNLRQMVSIILFCLLLLATQSGLADIVSIGPVDSFEATGNKGMITSIDGIPVEELLLGTSEYADPGTHTMVDVDNFSLANGDSADADDESAFRTIFDEPVIAVYLVECNGNDPFIAQGLDQDGNPTGNAVQSHSNQFLNSNLVAHINASQTAWLGKVVFDVPVWGILLTKTASQSEMSYDPVSVSGVAGSAGTIMPIYPQPLPDLLGTNVGPDMTFEWTFEAPEAIVSNYLLYLGTDADLAGGLLIDGISVSPASQADPTAQYAYSGIAQNTTYYWRVVANALEPNDVVPGLYDVHAVVEGPTWSFEGVSTAAEILTDPVDQYIVPDPITHLLTGEPVTLTTEFLAGKDFSIEWLKDGAAVDGSRVTVIDSTDPDNDSLHTSQLVIQMPDEPDQGVYSCTVQITGGQAVTSGEAAVYVCSEDDILAHRWSFNGESAQALVDLANPSDAELAAIIVDPDDQNIFLTGGEIHFAGRLEAGDNSNSADPNAHFVDLRNNIISELGNDMSLMVWFTWESASNWQRVCDFGISAGGEGVSQPSPDEDYIELTPRAGGAGSPLRLEAHVHPNVNLDHTSTAPLNEEICVLISWDSANNEFRMYVDGEYISKATLPAGKPLSSLNDLNCWLGRSSYNNDLFRGKINEFRIYGMPMNDAWAKALYEAGPDGEAVNVDPCVAPLDPKFDTNNDCIIDLTDLVEFITRPDNGWMSCGLLSCL